MSANCVGFASWIGLLVATSVSAPSQVTTQWDRTFGGTADDSLRQVRQTSDGGYIFGGTSYSGAGGDKSEDSRGSADYWIVKVNANGVKQWDRRVGGSSDDTLSALQQTTDGGYILGGTSYSGADGDKTASSRGGADFWIVKLDTNGVKRWDRRFGGSSDDTLSALQQTSDGGYILGGTSYSGANGDKTDPSRGDCDFWIVKVDTNGVKQWDRRFGGDGPDGVSAMQQTSDGGYILVGGSSGQSSGGDKTNELTGITGNWLYGDYWVVKTDAVGNKQWDRAFGGTEHDWPSVVVQASDGGFLVAGGSESHNSGNKQDFWTGAWYVKLTAAGIKQWDCVYGDYGWNPDGWNTFTAPDEVRAISASRGGGYMVAGISSTGSGYWFARLGDDRQLWSSQVRGDGYDDVADIRSTTDGGFIVAGTSDSPASGDKSEESRGGNDFWVVKLAPSRVLWTSASVSDALYAAKFGSSFPVVYGSLIKPDGGIFLLLDHDMVDASLDYGSSHTEMVAWEGCVAGSANLPTVLSASYSGGIYRNYWPNWFSMTTEPDGSPLVAFSQPTTDGSGTELRVARRDGGDWIPLGSSSLGPSGGGDHNMPQNNIAIAGDGSPLVVWVYTSSPGDNLFASKWNGSAWVPMGSGATTEGQGIAGDNTLDPALAIDAAGLPVTAYADYSNVKNPEIMVKRWNGASWQAVGGSGGNVSSSANFSMFPALAQDREGRMVIAWSEFVGTQDYPEGWWIQPQQHGAGLSHLNGEDAIFLNLFAPINQSGQSLSQSTSWTKGRWQIKIKAWDGSSWVNLQDPPVVPDQSPDGGSTSGHALLPKLDTLSDGQIVLAYRAVWLTNLFPNVQSPTNSVKVYHLAQNEWQEVVFTDPASSGILNARLVNLGHDLEGHVIVVTEKGVVRTENSVSGAEYDRLIVTTPYGNAVPPAGTNWFMAGVVTNLAIANSPLLNGTTQFVCRGWTGAGSVPSSGDTTNTGPVAITNNSAITWLWRTNYWLEVATNGSGSVDVADQWCSLGSNIHIFATPSALNQFAGWTGQTNGCAITGNQITVVMDRSRLVTANFARQCSLAVVTDYGQGTPPAGTNWYDRGTSVTAAITNSPQSSGSTQYVCRGWAGTGSAPASGIKTNAGPFTITTNSTITWLWRTNFWLDVGYAGLGRLSTNDCWLASGTNLVVTATASSHWHFAQWTGQTSGCTMASNKLTVVMDGPRTVAATFAIDRHRLTVTTPYGQASPPAGTNWVDYGSSALVAVTNSPVVSGGTQYVCRGWTGTGSVPASGTNAATAAFVLTADSTILWKWATNYWLHVDRTGQGNVSSNDAWIARGSSLSVTAAPAAYFTFGCWQGQTNGCTVTSNKITVVMNSARTVTAVFNAQLATNNVPKWWLAQYGLTNFNADAMRDVDRDGMLTWQEWLTGADPTNAASVFRLTSAQKAPSQGVVIRWPSLSNRLYHVYRTTNLLAGTNAFVALTGATNMSATPTENSYTDTVQGVGPYYYRIGVHE